MSTNWAKWKLDCVNGQRVSSLIKSINLPSQKHGLFINIGIAKAAQYSLIKTFKHILQLIQPSNQFLDSQQHLNMETYRVVCTSPQQFQKPSDKLFRDAYNSEINTTAAENTISYQYLDRLEENWTKTHESEEENNCMNDDEHDSLRIMKVLLKELDVEGHKMFKKLLHRVEKDVPADGLLREILHDLRGKRGSDMFEKFVRKINKGGDEGITSMDRGVEGDLVQKELEHKLERFKVKTVNIIGSGVVKEEGQ